MALEQSQGRGQYGTRWHTQPGEGLALSIVFYPHFLPARALFRLNAILALAVFEVLVEGVSARWRLKWPNDLYVLQDKPRKVGGILLESAISGQALSYAVFGLGLNLNQERFPVDLPNPASLFQIDGIKRDLRDVAFRLCERLELRYEQLRAGAWDAIKRQYLRNLLGYEESRRYADAGGEWIGIIRDVEDSGELVMDCGRQIRRFQFKELTFLE